MNGDAKSRMTIWCLLTMAAVVLIILIAAVLFFEPAHGGGPLDKTDQSAPASRPAH
jgi:hypothetical protein